MRKNFDSNSRHKIRTALETNLGVMLAVGLPLSFAAASVVGADILRPANPRIPAWVDNYKVSPNGSVCTITDLKTGEKFISREGKHVNMPRGFSVASSPSSCNVTAPDQNMCQLRGWPIEPIC